LKSASLNASFTTLASRGAKGNHKSNQQDKQAGA
jgi:hypothetical protein